jgi:predicted dehydrogenase
VGVKIGLVGVGRWGRTLAEVFTRCGASIELHDRKSDGPPIFGAGRRMPWGQMLAGRGMRAFKSNAASLPVDVSSENDDCLTMAPIEALIVAADPETTTSVTEAAIDAWMPAFITKPLLRDPRTFENQGYDWTGLPAPCMVDFWRLWSPAWRTLQKEIEAEAPREIVIKLHGDGPVRGYPGAHDYGPHVVAFLYDLFEEMKVDHSSVVGAEDASGKQVVNLTGTGKTVRGGDEVAFLAVFGNGSPEPKRSVEVTFKNGQRLEMVEDHQQITLVGRGLGSHEPKLHGLELQVRYFLQLASRAGRQYFPSPTLHIAQKATELINDVLAGRTPRGKL